MDSRWVPPSIFDVDDLGEDAALHYVPVPWDATVSYGTGTSLGPEAILRASVQIDLTDLDVEEPYRVGFHLREPNEELLRLNVEASALVDSYRSGGSAEAQEKVNLLYEQMNQLVSLETRALLDAGKLVGVLGGDHSVSLGAYRAISAKEKRFGILQFDAHMDLREAYEGFRGSHASIMRNALDHIPEIEKVVQVGIRDFCEEEWDYARSQGNRVRTFFDQDLKERLFSGVTWASICKEIVQSLPEKVWISFDIDGLDPSFCPNTGTPVPGGLNYSEAVYLLRQVARSGRTLLGFDLVEVAPGESEWDANVGMRLLYKISALMIANRGLRPFRMW